MYANDFLKLWRKLSRDMKAHMETQLGPLTEGQLNVLELMRSQERMKPSDFLTYLETTPAAVTTLLDRMEKNGLVKRDRDEEDRRIVWITPTNKGRQECERGLDVRERFMSDYLNRISSHNQQLLVYLLGKVANF